MRLKFKFLIDWPHGPYGYIPWTHKSRVCGETIFYSRSRDVRIDLERTFKCSRRKARRFHANQFQMFLDELVDTVAHEMVHVIEPKGERVERLERGAQLFGECAREVRR